MPPQSTQQKLEAEKPLPQTLRELFGSEAFGEEDNATPNARDYYRAFKSRKRTGILSPVRSHPPAPREKFFPGRQDEIVSKDELATLRKMSAEIEGLRADLASVCHSRAGEHRLADFKTYLDNPDSDSLKTLAESPALDKEHFEERKRQLRRAVKLAIQKKCDESYPLCRDVCERAASLVETELGTIIAAEKKIATHYGISPEPSNIVRALSSLAHALRLFPTGGGFNGPKQLLAGVLKL